MAKQRRPVSLADMDASTGATVDANGMALPIGDTELYVTGLRSKQDMAGALRRLADKLDRPTVAASTGVPVGRNEWVVLRDERPVDGHGNALVVEGSTSG